MARVRLMREVAKQVDLFFAEEAVAPRSVGSWRALREGPLGQRGSAACCERLGHGGSGSAFAKLIGFAGFLGGLRAGEEMLSRRSGRRRSAYGGL